MCMGDGKRMIGVPGLLSILLISRDICRIADSPFAITPTRLGITSAHGFGIKTSIIQRVEPLSEIR